MSPDAAAAELLRRATESAKKTLRLEGKSFVVRNATRTNDAGVVGQYIYNPLTERVRSTVDALEGGGRWPETQEPLGSAESRFADPFLGSPPVGWFTAGGQAREKAKEALRRGDREEFERHVVEYWRLVETAEARESLPQRRRR